MVNTPSGAFTFLPLPPFNSTPWHQTPQARKTRRENLRLQCQLPLVNWHLRLFPRLNPGLSVSISVGLAELPTLTKYPGSNKVLVTLEENNQELADDPGVPARKKGSRNPCGVCPAVD
jgi:hypothetical protein